MKKRTRRITCPVCGDRRVPGLMPHHMASAHPDHRGGKNLGPAKSGKPKKPVRKRKGKPVSDNGPAKKRAKRNLSEVPSSERKSLGKKPAAQPIGALKIPLSAKLPPGQRNEILGNALKVYDRHKHRGHEKALNAGQKYVDRRVREVTKGKVNIQYSIRAARQTPFKPIKGALGNPRKHQP